MRHVSAFKEGDAPAAPATAPVAPAAPAPVNHVELVKNEIGECSHYPATMNLYTFNHRLHFSDINMIIILIL